MVDSTLGSVTVGNPVQTQAMAKLTVTGHIQVEASVAIQSMVFVIGSMSMNASTMNSSAVGTNVTWTASFTLPVNTSMNGSKIVLMVTVSVQGAPYTLTSAPLVFNYYTTFEGI